MTRSPTRRTSIFLENIPRELVTDILSRVAAHSAADVSNVKLSCKELKETAEDPYVYQHASLDKFRIAQWFPLTAGKQFFLNKCRRSGNPELLYREAILDFFSKLEYESAYPKLEKAIELGHVGALYMACIIRLYSGNEKGITLIRNIHKENLRFWRKKFGNEVRQIWLKNPILEDRPRFCSAHGYKCQWQSGWEEEEEDEDDEKCDACSADREIRLISCRFS